MAILLALAASKELMILGIVAVAGNLPLEQTERNVRRVCEMAGRPDVLVYPGCPRPMQRALATAAAFHGDSLGDRLDLPEPTMPLQTRHGADFIVETVRAAQPGAVTLCALGPLTDVALAFTKAPDITPKIRELVILGGAGFEIGNVTPAAEFNIHADPHAAAIVLESSVTMTMIPLDVTHQVLSTPPRLAALQALRNRCGPAVAALLTSFEEARASRFGERGKALHDPCVIAYLLRPDLFCGREVNVTIEAQSPLTLGMTVVDWWGVTGRRPNVRFMNTVDAQGFYDLLTEKLAQLP